MEEWVVRAEETQFGEEGCEMLPSRHNVPVTHQ